MLRFQIEANVQKSGARTRAHSESPVAAATRTRPVASLREIVTALLPSCGEKPDTNYTNCHELLEGRDPLLLATP